MVHQHREYAVDAVRRAVGNAVDAEDCVQDAILRLLDREDIDPARARALLTRTAVNIAIDRLRSERRAQRAMQRLAAEESGRVVSPEHVIADRDHVSRVMAAIDTLPRRERQVLLLRLTGLSAVETARMLGLSAKSVEGAYTRARARVRLIVTGALMWLADRLRRTTSPHGEAFAAAVAVLVLVSPFWHRGVDSSPPTPRPGALSAMVTSGRGAGGDDAGGPAAGGAVQVSRDGRPAGGDEHHEGSSHGPDQVVVPTPRFTVPNPAAPPGSPPLLQAGGLTITYTPGDPVGDTERCLQNGGPRISLSNGGC